MLKNKEVEETYGRKLAIQEKLQDTQWLKQNSASITD
jgi:hypothetical protein